MVLQRWTDLRSSLVTLLHAMAPASTKYLSDRSSTPFVVRTTLAPPLSNFSILSFTMSDSLFRIFSSSAGSLTRTCTPMCIRAFWRFISKHAILAFFTILGIPCIRSNILHILQLNYCHVCSFLYLVDLIALIHANYWNERPRANVIKWWLPRVLIMMHRSFCSELFQMVQVGLSLAHLLMIPDTWCFVCTILSPRKG